jgi:lipopolysaccharide export system protein LptC
MNKKTYLQFFLFAIIIILTYSFYKTYFNQEPISKVPRNIKDESVSENKSNMIHNIEYNTKDDAGNSYIIKSKKGELNLEDPDLILMKGVTAVISMVNSTPIKIYSDNAIYNKSNYNTSFYDNVLVNYMVHNIASDNLDLLLEKNLATFSNNIIYKNLNTELEADKIEIDLITKKSKIFMDNKSKKVKIVKLN